jgi:hypothetical protein
MEKAVDGIEKVLAISVYGTTLLGVLIKIAVNAGKGVKELETMKAEFVTLKKLVQTSVSGIEAKVDVLSHEVRGIERRVDKMGG